MKLKITYPPVEKRKLQRRHFLRIIRWPVLFAVVMSPVVNYIIGGKAWSLIVLMSIYMAWSLVLSPDLVEYNRISQTIKLISFSCSLLAMIDFFLSPGWAIDVVPIVCFGGLVITGVLFFTDLDRQKQNMLPMLFLIVIAILGSIVGVSIWREKSGWPLIIMGATAGLLLLACIITLRGEFLRELKKRFHVK
ncbi:MAG: hypothetical protein GX924_01775 [Clostridiaceae bacterium]|nr:hypothetical protein [Clostridiaceae bacterium]